MSFKNIFYLVFIFIVGLSSCKKDEHVFQSTGSITGPALAECICCGGYFIDMNDSTYHFDILPISSKIDLQNETFPIAVKLDWSYDRKCGGIQYITIERIEKQ